jgi:biotin transporter BioY
MKQSPLIVLVFISTLVGWALKQVTNIIQVFTLEFSCSLIATHICMYIAGIMELKEYIEIDQNGKNVFVVVLRIQFL